MKIWSIKVEQRQKKFVEIGIVGVGVREGKEGLDVCGLGFRVKEAESGGLFLNREEREDSLGSHITFIPGKGGDRERERERERTLK